MRIAFYIENEEQPLWVIQLIEQVANLEEVSIVYFILNGRPVNFLNKESIATKIYKLFDNKLFNFSSLNHQSSFKSFPKIEVININLAKRGFNYLLEEDLTILKNKSLDYIVSLDNQYLEYKIGLANYGLLQFLPKVNEDLTYVLIGNVLQQKQLSTISLIWSDNNQIVKLQDITTKTDRYSAKRTAVKLFCRKSEVLRKKLTGKINTSDKELAEYKQEKIEKKTGISLFNIVIVVFRLLTDKIRDALFETHWDIRLSQNYTLQNLGSTTEKSTLLQNPNNSFWADPFLIEKEGNNYVFFEEYPYKTRKGILSCVKVDSEFNVEKYWTIMEKDYHLSFPFLMREQGELLMIPETCNSESIDLYKCVSFPDKWKFQFSLLQGIKAADSIIEKIDNIYWLFTCVSNSEELEVFEDLYLFYADEVEGEWIPHPMNPIKTDIQCSRPAGALVEYNSEYYRPVQNGAGGYGHAINFYKIRELNTLNYEEEKVELDLYPYLKTQTGIHTYNESNSAQVFDVKSYRSKISFVQ